MTEEAPFDSQQESTPQSWELSLSADQALYLQKFMPRLFSLVDAKKTLKKQKKESNLLMDAQSQSQSNHLSRNPSARRPKDKEHSNKKAQPKMIEEEIIKYAPTPTITLSQEDINFYLAVLAQIKKTPSAFPFLKPVDPIVLEIPDYFDVIKHPMDLSTIEKKLKQKQYQVPSEFTHDLNQIWVNSYSYNAKGSDMYVMTTEMEKFCNKLLQRPSVSNVVSITQGVAKKPVQLKDSAPKPKRVKPAIKQNKVMTTQQKQQLKLDIQQLSGQHLSGVWEIMCKDREQKQRIFDIAQLEPERLKRLQALVRDAGSNKKKEEKKVVESVFDIHTFVSEESSSFVIDDEE